MVAHQMANGHYPPQQAFPPHQQQQHGPPGGQYPIPSPAMSNHSLPGPNGSVPQQAPYPHQSIPYNAMPPYPEPNAYLHPHFQPQYPPQGPGPQYGNHPYFPNPPHNQMGGPGPATMHNGYNAYQPNGYMSRQPVMGQPQQHQPGPQANGHDAMIQPHFNQFPPPGEGYYSHPSQPPPPFGQPDGHYQPNYHYQAPPYPQHQPPVYPPGHPYSQGHGYGFTPPLMHHNGYNGHVYNGEHPSPPPVVQHSRPPPTKSLNPAARGFVFRSAIPQQQTPRDGYQQPSTEPANGGQTPTPASTASSADTSAKPIVNSGPITGDASAPTLAPVSQDGGLGLSQMEPATSQLSSTSTSTESPASNKAEYGITPSMSRASGISSDTENVVQTPQGEAPSDEAATPTSNTAKTVHPEAPSPNSTIVPSNRATFGTAPTVQSQIPPPAGQRPYSIVQISRGRPSHDSSAGVTFHARTLRTRPPHMSPVQNVYLELEPMGEKDEKTSTSKLAKYLVSMGTGNDTPARIIDTSLVFGEITVEEIPAIVLRAPPAEKPSTETPTKVEDAAPEPEVAAPVPAPAPLPKAKPASWAALLKPTLVAQIPSDTFSTGPSSVRVSPSKSIISLATDTDALTEVDATTPRSVAPSLPPSVPAPAARPVFNYASAAASGRGPTPQEELVKLMTDGLRAKPKGPPASSIPRGLINTGNMCYANTVCPSHV
jgi:ubiquitin carboxyl-terminal hydrolase 10